MKQTVKSRCPVCDCVSEVKSCELKPPPLCSDFPKVNEKRKQVRARLYYERTFINGGEPWIRTAIEHAWLAGYAQREAESHENRAEN